MNLSRLFEIVNKLNALLPYYGMDGKAFLPFRIYFELTDRCNFSCTNCCQRSQQYNKKKDEELTFNQVTSLIDKLPKRAVIIFSGGEPMIRKDFFDIINYSSGNFKTGFITNGSMLNESSLNKIKNSNLIFLGISIDSLQDETNLKLGRNILNHSLLKKSIINNNIRNKISIIDIKTTLYDQTEEEILNIYSYARSINADYFTLSLPKMNSYQFNSKLFSLGELLRFENNCESINLNILRFEKLKKVVEEITLNKGNLRGPKLRIYPKIKKASLFSQKPLMYKPCMEPWTGLSIRTNGDVYPCLSVKIGSMLNSSFKEVWNSKNYKLFRSELRKRKFLNVCDGCCYAYIK